MSRAARLAGLVAATPPGVVRRLWYVAAVHAGPPHTVDLSATYADATAGTPVLVAAGIRIGRAYLLVAPGPVQGDAVYVLITTSGGSVRDGGRVHGGEAFVVDTVAV